VINLALKLAVNRDLRNLVEELYMEVMFHISNENGYKYFANLIDTNNAFANYYVGNNKTPEKTAISALFKALKTLVEAIIYYVSYYVPKDTGNLLDSLRVEQLDESVIKIYFDLKQAPYGIYVHEIPYYKHKSPTKHKFLEDAVSSAVYQSGINFFSINTTVEADELSVVINGKEDNSSEQFANYGELKHNMGDIPEFSDIELDKKSIETSFVENAYFGAYLEQQYYNAMHDKDLFPFESNMMKNPHYASLRIDSIDSMPDSVLTNIKKKLNNPYAKPEYQMHMAWAKAAYTSTIMTFRKFKYPTIKRILK
jgi:hypothetical protein